MFVIEANGEKHLFQNKKSEDFLRFMPNYFGVNKEDLIIHYVSDEKDRRDLINFRSADRKNSLDISESGKIKKCQKDQDDMLKELEEVVLSPLNQWPYDKQGKFLGIP